MSDSNNLPENIDKCTHCKIVGEGELNPIYTAARNAVAGLDLSSLKDRAAPSASGRNRGGIG